MKRRSLMLLCLPVMVALLVSAIPTSAQSILDLDGGDLSVGDVLDISARSFWGGGLREPLPRASGTLRDGRSTEIEYTLERNVSYTFLGVCAADCSDLYLELLDASGAPVARDVLSDHLAAVRITPESSSVYRLRVSMNQCDWENCSFGIGVFEGVAPAVVHLKGRPAVQAPASESSEADQPGG